MKGEPAIPPNSRAILIGVPRYQAAEYRSYTAVGNSVEGMYRLLVESGLCGWREEQVEKISDPVNAGLLLGRLRRLAQATTGVLLLYFVGHGVPSEHNGELCLAIADTDHANPDSTGLEYAKIKRMLHSGTPAATKIAILDCCYSGRAIGLGTADDGTQLAELSDCAGAYTLTAADERAHVPTDEDGNLRTAFTAELLDLLMRDGVPGGPADLTLGAIFPRLRQRLVAKGLPRPNQRCDDAAAAFVFARNAASSTSEADPGEQFQPERIGRKLPESRLAHTARRDPTSNNGNKEHHEIQERASVSPAAQVQGCVRQEAPRGTTIDRDYPAMRPVSVAMTEPPAARRLSRRSVLGVLGGLAIVPLGYGLATAFGGPQEGGQQEGLRVVDASSAITLASGHSMAFSPDGKTLVAETEVGLTLWDVAKHVQVATLTMPGTKVPARGEALAFSPNGKIIAAGTWDGTVNLWDARTRKHTDTFYSETSRLYSVAFSPDSKTLGIAGDNDVVLLWSIAAPDDPPIRLRERLDFTNLVEPNGTPLVGDMLTNSVAFSPDGSLIATGQGGTATNPYTDASRYTGSLQLWGARTHRNIATLTASDHIGGIAFSPDSKTLVSASATGVTLWRLSDHKKISTNAVVPGQGNCDCGDNTKAVAFSPNGKILAGAADTTVKLWNHEANTQTTLDNGNIDPLISLAFSPDGKILATGGSYNLRLWPLS